MKTAYLNLFGTYLEGSCGTDDGAEGDEDWGGGEVGGEHAAHQVQVDGYKMHRWGGHQAFPSVITVFSAPNYCGEYHNKGAVILIENDKMIT